MVKLSPKGVVDWAKQMGSASPSDGDFGRSIAITPQGKVLVTGFFSANAQFGTINLTSTGQRDVFVEELDSSGNVLWAKGFGGNAPDLGQSIVVDSLGNSYITGSYQNSITFGSTVLNATAGSTSNVFVVKLDTSGNAVWAESWGGNGDDTGFGIAIDGSDNLYVTGNYTGLFDSTTFSSAGDSDVFVTKYSSAGRLLWEESQGGPGHDDGTGVAVDSSGNVFVTGDFIGKASFGTVQLSSAGQDDVFIERLSTSGTTIWAKSLGGTGFDAGFGIAVDGNDNVYGTGVFQGTASFGGTTLTSNGDYDVYYTKLDSNGNVLQALGLGSAGADQAFQIGVSGTPATAARRQLWSRASAFAIGDCP